MDQAVKQAKHTVVPPIPPKIARQLDEWLEPPVLETELENCAVNNKDFSMVQRLEVEGCELTNVNFAGAILTKLQVSDSKLRHIDGAGMAARESSCLRVIISDSRLTGINLGGVFLKDCLFENVKLDEAGLRFAVLKRVRFNNCVLRNLDLSSAKLSHVSFSGCDLEGVNFSGVACDTVDLRGETLTSVKGVAGLKGATISSEQLIQLAPLLAAEAGLDIDYET